MTCVTDTTPGGHRHCLEQLQQQQKCQLPERSSAVLGEANLHIFLSDLRLFLLGGGGRGHFACTAPGRLSSSRRGRGTLSSAFRRQAAEAGHGHRRLRARAPNSL